MPNTSPYPEFAAVRAYVKSIGGHTGLAERHGIAPRTAQRLYSGGIKPNPRLLSELLEAANG